MVDFTTPQNHSIIYPLLSLSQRQKEAIVIYVVIVMGVAAKNGQKSESVSIFLQKLCKALEIHASSIENRIALETDDITSIKKDFSNLGLNQKKNIFLISYLYIFLNSQGNISVEVDMSVSEIAEDLLNFDFINQQQCLFEVNFFN